jgi:hypothetical protein
MQAAHRSTVTPRVGLSLLPISFHYPVHARMLAVGRSKTSSQLNIDADVLGFFQIVPIQDSAY